MRDSNSFTSMRFHAMRSDAGCASLRVFAAAEREIDLFPLFSVSIYLFFSGRNSHLSQRIDTIVAALDYKETASSAERTGPLLSPCL